MHFQNRNHNKNEHGLALITVLLIFALVSMLAVSIQTQQEYTIRQAASTLSSSQKYTALLSIEDFAKAGLMYDYKRDTDANELWDTGSELWNKPFPLQLENIQAAIYIRDLQGLFNLNSLHPSHPQNASSKIRFKRLLDELGIESGMETVLAQWFIKDHSSNYDYQNQDPAYSASEIQFTHPSELLLITGVTHEQYRKLEPYITALPVTTPLNVNTTYPEILSAWDGKLTLEQSREIVNKTRSNNCGPLERNNFVISDIDSFFEEAAIKELSDPNKNPDNTWDKGDFDVKTKYFSVLSTVKLNGEEVALESIVLRDLDSDFVGTIYRDFSRQPDDIVRLVKTMNCAGA